MLSGGIWRWCSLVRKRAKRALNVSQKPRHIARLPRIPFGFAQGRLSPRKERLLRMTIKLHHRQGFPQTLWSSDLDSENSQLYDRDIV
jgi:hypothetical protein